MNPAMRLPSLLPILPVTLSCGSRTMDTYALLDSGSSLTLLTDAAARHLVPDLEPNETITVAGVHSTNELLVASLQVTIGPYRSSTQPYTLDNVVTVPRLNLNNVQPDIINEICHKNPHLSHIVMSTLANKNVSLLIGMDAYDLILSRVVINGPPNSPMAINTLLGWTVAGRSSAPPTTAQTNYQQCSRTDDFDRNLYQQVSNWIEFDTTGVNEEVYSYSQENKMALKILQSTTKQVNGQYEIGLLWRDDVKLPNNRIVAELQLRSVQQRLNKDPHLKNLFQETIDTKRYIVAKRYITEVLPESDTAAKAWFHPHHPVTNINKPGKVRTVTNASSTYQGVSLNSSLLTGPDLLCNLTGLVMRFRQGTVAVSADIEAMFLEVKVKPEDQPFLRFRWTKNGQQITYQYTSHIFGATDSPCVACYAVQRCAADHAHSRPEIQRIISEDIYMDDLFTTFDTGDRATFIAEELRNTLVLGGFNSTKWSANNLNFLYQTEQRHLVPNAIDDFLANKTQRVLGVQWKPSTDTYIIDLEKFLAFLDKDDMTQRELLKWTSSIFDPLGLTGPLTIRLRQALQDTWKQHLSWDTKLDTSRLPDLVSWIKEIDKIQTLAIPRHYFKDSSPATVQLHIFDDASEKAIANVAYFRIIKKDQSVQIRFIIGKNRVTPLKRMTVPNLELQPAANGARLANFSLKEHRLLINSTFCWTDSTATLKWINTADKRQKIFVANRLNIILETTTANQWNYVPTESNPADDGTRGYKAEEMTASSRWIK